MGHAGSEAIRSGANSRVDGWSGMRCGPSRAKVWMEIRSFHTLPSTDMWNWSSNQGLLMVDGRGGFNASRVIGNFSWFGDDSCLGLVGASSSNLTSKTQNWWISFPNPDVCACVQAVYSLVCTFNLFSRLVPPSELSNAYLGAESPALTLLDEEVGSWLRANGMWTGAWKLLNLWRVVHFLDDLCDWVQLTCIWKHMEIPHVSSTCLISWPIKVWVAPTTFTPLVGHPWIFGSTGATLQYSCGPRSTRPGLAFRGAGGAN